MAKLCVVVRTKEGLLIGPFDNYESADAFANECIFEIDDVYVVGPPRPDQKRRLADPGRPR